MGHVLSLSFVHILFRIAVVPDAVILTTITNQLTEKRSYRISAGNWDDYGYKTVVKGLGIDFLRIGFIMQASEDTEHTIEKLKSFYQVDESGEVIIDSPLPKQFYSFWDVPEGFDLKCLDTMRYFNHFFYLAVERGCFNWDSFYQEIIQPLDVNFDLSHKNMRIHRRDNIFVRSLLRGYDGERLKKEFSNFIEQLLDRYEEFFEIIDIKYLTSDYFCDPSKIEEIKSRSVRKQFVYEYLLQKKLQGESSRFRNLGIRSSFWLPSYHPDDPNLLEEGDTFLDGYIQLKNANFKILADHYLSSL